MKLRVNQISEISGIISNYKQSMMDKIKLS